eukprot:5034257-Lingulodinium_polyedra.AAC.1
MLTGASRSSTRLCTRQSPPATSLFQAWKVAFSQEVYVAGVFNSRAAIPPNARREWSRVGHVRLVSAATGTLS